MRTAHPVLPNAISPNRLSRDLQKSSRPEPMARRSFLNAVATTPLLAPWSPAVRADHGDANAPYPHEKPIRWVVPYPAGGGSDTNARTVAGHMRHHLKQDFLIDNRPGAATNIAAELVANAQPDGYTIMTADNGLLFYNEHLFSNLRFSPANDFSYIGALGRFPLALVLSRRLPHTTYDAFVTHARTHPDRLTYASAGNGSPHHMAMELFKTQSGLQIRHVPHQGAAPAMLSLMGGEVDCMFIDLSAALSLMQVGKVHSLALASPKRSPALPQLPTFHELKVPDVEAFALQGMVGPAKMPDDIVHRLNTALNGTLSEPQVHKRMTEFGFEPMPISPDAFRQMARTESARWGQIIQKIGLKLD